MSIKKHYKLKLFKSQRNELKNLIQFYKEINSINKSKFLKNILDFLSNYFEMDNIFIFLENFYENNLFILKISSKKTIKKKIQKSNLIINALNNTLSYINIKDLSKNDYYEFFIDNEEWDIDHIFPFKTENKLNGFLMAKFFSNSSKYLIQKKRYYLDAFITLLNPLIENFILSDLVQTDRMTKLYDQHYFVTRLNEEFQRAKRYNHDLSLIIIDIDYFKQINDNYGHQTGDNVLIEFSQFLLSEIRKTDILARYGGEEFTIILFETSIHESLNVAKKIKYKLHIAEFQKKLKLKSKITVSMGLSSLKNSKANNSFNLIHFADNALYESKNNGRNKITTYHPIKNKYNQVNIK